MWLYYRVKCPKDTDGIANSADPDQIAPQIDPDQTLGAVWSGCALFAKTCLSENLGSLWYINYIKAVFKARMNPSFAKLWLLPVFFKRKSTLSGICLKYELPHDKTNKMTVRPAKNQIRLGIRPVWSESSLSAWRKLGSLATHWAHCEDTDQTGQTPRLRYESSLGAQVILLALSWGGWNGRLNTLTES